MFKKKIQTQINYSIIPFTKDDPYPAQYDWEYKYLCIIKLMEDTKLQTFKYYFMQQLLPNQME